MAKYNSMITDRVIDAIHKYIDVNGLKEGDLLPSERKLAELWQVSRGTVRDAIARLVNEGILYTLKGCGSFIAPLKEHIDMKDMISFSNSILLQGKKPGSKVVAHRVITADDYLADKLNISAGKRVHMLKRVRQINGEDILIETSYIPYEKCQGLEKFNFDNVSLYNILEIHYGLYMSHQDISVQLSKATEEEAGYLSIEVGNPVFVESAVAYAGGAVAEYTRTIVNAARACYSISFGDTKNQ